MRIIVKSLILRQRAFGRPSFYAACVGAPSSNRKSNCDFQNGVGQCTLAQRRVPSCHGQALDAPFHSEGDVVLLELPNVGGEGSAVVVGLLVEGVALLKVLGHCTPCTPAANI